MEKVCTEEYLNRGVLAYNLQWFAKDGEGGEKTEPATQKKLTDARKEGKVARSKELSAAFALIVLFLCLKIFVSYVGQKFLGIFQMIYGNMSDFYLIGNSPLPQKGSQKNEAGNTNQYQ